MPSFGVVATTLGNLTLVAIVMAMSLSALLLSARGRVLFYGSVTSSPRVLLASAWLVVTTATLGSLYFSEVTAFTPCLLCWYQRILMYPLVLILGVAILGSDARVWRYAVPLTVVGLLTAGYHYSLQLRPEVASWACTAEAPCSARYVAVYGFISIPFMAGAAFLLTTVLVLAARWAARQPSRPASPNVFAPYM